MTAGKMTSSAPTQVLTSSLLDEVARLAPLIARFFGRAELGPSVSLGRRRCIGDRFNPERTHQQHGRIVAGAHPPWPAG